MPVPIAQAVPGRRGITLLEVLIAIFVLAVGILSVFALFTAGRELESRASVKSNAMAFAAAQRDSIATDWLECGQWLRVRDPMNGNPVATDPMKWTFRWVKPDAGPPDPNGQPMLPVTLPVLIDPWGVCKLPAGEAFRQPGAPWETAPDPDLYWDWSRFLPLTSAKLGEAGVEDPFLRLSLSGTRRPGLAAGVIDPFLRETTIATLADQDAIEYRPAPDASDPPLNAFEAGRRKRGTDLIPALFIAASTPEANAVEPGAAVRRSLLVFHKPVPDFESTGPDREKTYWPSGVIELRVTQNEEGLIIAKLTKQPDDPAVVRRSLRPGKWVLFTCRLPREADPGHYFYDAAWRELTSVTKDDDDSWLMVPRTDLPAPGGNNRKWPRTPEPVPPDSSGNARLPVVKWETTYPDPSTDKDVAVMPNPYRYSPISCYAFEHLVHVDEIDSTSAPQFLK